MLMGNHGELKRLERIYKMSFSKPTADGVLQIISFSINYYTELLKTVLAYFMSIVYFQVKVFNITFYRCLQSYVLNFSFFFFETSQEWEQNSLCVQDLFKHSQNPVKLNVHIKFNRYIYMRFLKKNFLFLDSFVTGLEVQNSE